MEDGRFRAGKGALTGDVIFLVKSYFTRIMICRNSCVARLKGVSYSMT